jgi:hypothetical protein
MFFGALPQRNSIRGSRIPLRRSRWPDVIEEAPVHIVDDKDDGILPVRAVAHCLQHLRNERLPSLDVRWRVFIVFELDSEKPEIGIHKSHHWQLTYTGHSRRLRQEKRRRQEVRICAGSAEQAKARLLRHVRKIVGPCYLVANSLRRVRGEAYDAKLKGLNSSQADSRTSLA